MNNQNAADFPGVINSQNIDRLNQISAYSSYLSSNVDNAAFIRFNELILGYDVTKYCKDNSYLTFINKLNVYLQIRDLGIIWAANKWGMDPENREGTIKPQTTYTFGLKINI